MKLVFRNEIFAVYDDVLSKNDFARLWHYTQIEDYFRPERWHKVWRLTDGAPMRSSNYEYANRPFGCGMDIALKGILALARKHPEFVGKRDEAWDNIYLASYLYPRGTKLAWHGDGTYSGACILYTHQKWSSSWGGELLIAKSPDRFRGNPGPGSYLNHEWMDGLLSKPGLGHFVYPKPNRAVISSPSVFHTIARVDDDAGDHVRSAVSSFFLPKK